MKEPLIVSGQDWSFDLIEEVIEHIERIAHGKYELDTYTNKIEVITSEQMHDAYCSNGLPIFYPHWSFGEQFVKNLDQYKRGRMGLAYEIVINCLKDDSFVYSDRGIIDIGDILINDKIWNGKEFISILALKKSKAKCFEIELENGISLISTSEHRYQVVTNNNVEIKNTKDLSCDDWFIQPQSVPEYNLRADLSDFNYIPPVCGFKEKYCFQPYCHIPHSMDENLAELMGIIIGDGCISHTMKRSFYISVGHDAEEYEYYVIDLIKKVFDIEPKVYERPSQKYPDKMNKSIYVCSNEIKEFLNFCGLSKKFTHKNKRIPWSILESDEKCKAAFIRGLFDTDGSVKKNHGKSSGISISCYNNKLGKDISIVLTSMGISNIVKKHNNQHISSINIVSDGRINFVNKISSSHKKKFNLLQELMDKDARFINDGSKISKLPEIFGKNVTRTQYLKSNDNDFVEKNRFIKIKNITEIVDEQNVVDIMVDSNDHLFWSNGILTHNSNPCISYLMEENTMGMQTLVIAHAGYGHNSFFKTNYLFRKWTDASTIIDYLTYAKKYVLFCENEYGAERVESTLDAAHSIQMHGIYKYKHPIPPSAAQEEKLREERESYIQSQVNEIWKTIPQSSLDGKGTVSDDIYPKEPQENIVMFIAENAPRLEDWQREILRIVSNVSQYFYPQMQTKISNEGNSCFWHYTIMNDLYDEGIVSDDAMIEFHQSHANVLFQPDYDEKYFNGINPYKLGFSIYQDVKRICLDPTEEDREWFVGQEWVGSGDWVKQIKYIAAEFKDESLIKQYLSPKVIRDLKLFDVIDDERDSALEVAAIHDDAGYKKVRNALSETYNIGYNIPDIQVANVDRWGNRSMELRHVMTHNRPLDEVNASETISHIGYLWGYDIILHSIDNEENVRMGMIYNHDEDEIGIEIYS